MPEISPFLGIVIKMFYNDHTPPHFHAEYGSSVMLVAIETLGVIAGKGPRKISCATPLLRLTATQRKLPSNRMDRIKKPGRQLPAASAEGMAQIAARGLSDALAAGGC